MKPSFPAERSEQGISAASPNLEEESHTASSPPSCARSTALLDEISALTETTSVAGTLRLTAQLLAEVESVSRA
jgi:hypothetical protein